MKTDNTRTDNTRTDNTRTDNIGTDNIGTDNIGTDNIGTDNIGTDNIGTDNKGVGPTTVEITFKCEVTTGITSKDGAEARKTYDGLILSLCGHVSGKHPDFVSIVANNGAITIRLSEVVSVRIR